MTRWHYLIPRLVILGLVLVLVWISVDPLLKYAIVRSAESVTGAKVDVGQVKSSILEGKVYISDLAITDPRDPMKNLLQADVAYLKLDPRRLLHKQWIVEHGHSQQVVFGSPRTVSGDLSKREFDSTSQDADLHNVVVKNAVPIDSQAWLDQFQSLGPSTNETDWEVTRVSTAVMKKWPAVFQSQLTRVDQAKARLKLLTTQLDGQLVNPLPGRDLERNQKIRNEIRQLADEINGAQVVLNQFVDAAEADRQLIAEAKARDAQTIASKIQANQIDADSISQLLLQKQQAEYVSEVVGWVHWFRNAIPNPEEDFQAPTLRGTNIQFQGQSNSPKFLVKTLDLDGQGSLAGQHFKFAGVAKNLTNQPMFHDQPTTFELRAQGSHHLMVDCVLDRREPVWQDRMVIKCPELNAPSQMLGDAGSIEIEMADSRIQVDLDISVCDNQLSGTLRFSHSKCAMLVNQLHPLAGGDDVRLRMNQELLGIKRFQTVAALGGTLDNPSVRFESDLGTKLAGAMNQILESRSSQQTAEVQNRLNTQFAAELQGIDAMFNERFKELSQQLEKEATAVAELLENVPETERWPRMRR